MFSFVQPLRYKIKVLCQIPIVSIMTLNAALLEDVMITAPVLKE